MAKGDEFRHPFIRAHAKYAALFHTAILVILAVMFTLFSTRGDRIFINFEILDIKISHIIFTLAFLVCFFGLIHGLYRASKRLYPSFSIFKHAIHSTSTPD